MFPGDKFDIKTYRTINKYKYAKATLLGIASIAFAVIIFWPSLKDIFETPKESPKQVIEEPVSFSPPPLSSETGEAIKNSAKDIRFHGTDKSNQPYVLVASDGNENEEEVVFLTKPQLTLTLKSGNIMTLTSLEGTYDKIKSLVMLKGEVVVTHSAGYQFVTSLAWIDLMQSMAYGDQKVTGEGPKGEIEANGGFKLSDKGDKILFLGRPELILRNKKDQNNE